MCLAFKVPFLGAILSHMGCLAASEAIEFFALVILAGHLCYFLAVARLLFIFLSFSSFSVFSSIVTRPGLGWTAVHEVLRLFPVPPEFLHLRLDRHESH